jgi:transcriptional antiterminator RfaH
MHPNPDDLVERKWFACYTRPRHEKRVEEVLRERGFESYLPLRPLERRWKDRRKTVDFPMFPSYVFGFFDLRDASRVLAVPGIVTLVKVNGKPLPVREDELQGVRRLAEALNRGEIEARPVAALERGQRVGD